MDSRKIADRAAACLLKGQFGSDSAKNNAACNILALSSCLTKRGVTSKKEKCLIIHDLFRILIPDM